MKMKKYILVNFFFISFIYTSDLGSYDKIQYNPETGELLRPDSLLKKEDMLYLSNKKSQLTSGMLSFLLNITGSGHLYAGGGKLEIWLRSVPFSSVLLFILSKYSDSDAAPGGVRVLYMLAYMGLIYDSINMVEKYNIRLHNQIYLNQIKTSDELKKFEVLLELRQLIYD